MISAGLVYPITIVCAGFAAAIWSVLFGLPSARVKGFYLIMTTMAAQCITVSRYHPVCQSDRRSGRSLSMIRNR